MSKHTKRPELRERTSLPLKGTTRTTQAALDHDSAFALSWAQSWLSTHGSKKVPTGGVIRRALALDVYVTHLEACTLPQDEVRSVARACSKITASKEAQQAAFQRLQQATEARELQPYTGLLLGPQVALDVAMVNAKTDEFMAHLAGTRWGRLKGIK